MQSMNELSSDTSMEELGVYAITVSMTEIVFRAYITVIGRMAQGHILNTRLNYIYAQMMHIYTNSLAALDDPDDNVIDHMKEIESLSYPTYLGHYSLYQDVRQLERILKGEEERKYPVYEYENELINQLRTDMRFVAMFFVIYRTLSFMSRNVGAHVISKDTAKLVMKVCRHVPLLTNLNLIDIHFPFFPTSSGYTDVNTFISDGSKMAINHSLRSFAYKYLLTGKADDSLDRVESNYKRIRGTHFNYGEDSFIRPEERKDKIVGLMDNHLKYMISKSDWMLIRNIPLKYAQDDSEVSNHVEELTNVMSDIISIAMMSYVLAKSSEEETYQSAVTIGDGPMKQLFDRIGVDMQEDIDYFRADYTKLDMPDKLDLSTGFKKRGW